MKRFDTKRPEFSPYGFACESWTPTRMSRPDRHNEIELNLLTAGSLTYLLGGQRTTIEAGRLGVFWAAIPHQIVEIEGDAPYFVVTLPLSEFLRAGLDLSFVNRILQGELLVDFIQYKWDEMAFQRWEQDLKADDRVLERAARLEVQARMLRFAHGMTDGAVTTSMAALTRADQIACYIARNYQQPLTSQSIAEATDVHANYAMTLFRKTFGTTMTAFIIQHRISHAQRLLVTTDDAILNVALDSGFQSLSRFNEAFKAGCGCAPREFRKSHRPTTASQSSS
ncbi:helix-turn-helix domain-containing protein [Rubripirellula reticaptiva]|uniref:Melibiose operon regulatory protein n=1 Tax=Rubripirellula reticaptiva TaxID=2528013 RepID=A0A5C6ENQ1_9BACT|nr:helix-turn-helix domain-containing protein [Rubripirellula reticaptiva]TWU49241.1 Melibiose operon regulatory protein [Rubripirellula reticaptiva]